MADQEIPSSLPSQILAETLELVKRRQFLEPSEIAALTDLANTGGFRRAEQLIALLKNKEAADHEAS